MTEEELKAIEEGRLAREDLERRTRRASTPPDLYDLLRRIEALEAKVAQLSLKDIKGTFIK